MERDNNNPAQRVFDIPDLKNEIYSFVIHVKPKIYIQEKNKIKDCKETCMGFCCLPCNMYYLFKILIHYIR